MVNATKISVTRNAIVCKCASSAEILSLRAWLLDAKYVGTWLMHANTRTGLSQTIKEADAHTENANMNVLKIDTGTRINVTIPYGV